MTIKTISPNYCKQAIDVYKRAFENDLRLNMKLIRKYIKKNIYEITILLDDNEKLVGFAFLIPLEKYSIRDVIHIDYLAIDPLHQGKGYVSKLLNKIIKENCTSRITLECGNKLIGLYEKFNFVKICDNEFKGKQMNFMTRGLKNRINHKKIMSILHVLQHPDLYLGFKLPDIFIENLTYTIGVIKIHRMWYSKYDAWIKKRLLLYS